MLWTSHTFNIPFLPIIIIIIIIMYSSYSFISHHLKYVFFCAIYRHWCVHITFVEKNFLRVGLSNLICISHSFTYTDRIEAKIRYFVRRKFYQNIVQFPFNFSLSIHSLAPLSPCATIFL